MDMLNYYTTTMATAFSKIGPVLLFIAVSYVVFIKLPFLLLVKAVAHKESNLMELKHDSDAVNDPLRLKEKPHASKPDLRQAPGQESAKDSGEDSKKDHKKNDRSQSKKGAQQESRQDSRNESKQNQRKHQEKTQDHSHSKKEAPSKHRPTQESPESVFELTPGQAFSKSELKKKYYDLLKMNHPDKVASLGQDFKVLAEKKTKDINSAYDRLKNRAS
ncbi:MAG TPA: J domain-containing protein [Bacteriovoracaceae bacterium]|nr:J domain-containing protein [Bacteriovoracaceae bacterium]